MTNCCDDYGNCTQGRDCPIRHTGVAKVGYKMPAADPLPPSIWRHQLRRLAYWMLIYLALVGLTVWSVLIYLALRA